MNDSPLDQGWTGVDVDGAGIDMFPVLAQKMMSDIATALTDAQDGWKASDSRILSLEGKLGEGPMGKPVREQYNPAAKQMREFITQILERLDKLSDAGTKAVPLYVEQDMAAGQHFEF